MGARIFEPIPVYRYENPFLYVTHCFVAGSLCMRDFGHMVWPTSID